MLYPTSGCSTIIGCWEITFSCLTTVGKYFGCNILSADDDDGMVYICCGSVWITGTCEIICVGFVFCI